MADTSSALQSQRYLGTITYEDDSRESSLAPEASLAAADDGLAAEDSLRGLVMATFGDEDRQVVAQIVVEEWVRHTLVTEFRNALNLANLPIAAFVEKLRERHGDDDKEHISPECILAEMEEGVAETRTAFLFDYFVFDEGTIGRLIAISTSSP